MMSRCEDDAKLLNLLNFKTSSPLCVSILSLNYKVNRSNGKLKNYKLQFIKTPKKVMVQAPLGNQGSIVQGRPSIAS